MQLSGKTYVVFGAGSGLGRATALELAKQGAFVVASDVDHARLKADKQLLEACRATIGADVTIVAQVRSVVDAAMGFGTSLRGAVNTAGILHGERVLGRRGVHDAAVFERVLRVNVIGTFNVLCCSAEAMARNEPDSEAEKGVIVNTASVAAYEGQGGQVAYATSKAAVAGMTLPAARDLSRHGIRVVSIAPGLFHTPMVAGLDVDSRAALEQQIPFPARAGRPEEFAALACHVLTNHMINGEVIRIDGGLRMSA